MCVAQGMQRHAGEWLGRSVLAFGLLLLVPLAVLHGSRERAGH
jgi:hypothetical protein